MNMTDIQLIDEKLLSDLHAQAAENARLRMHLDLRTTPDDTSQRMLNALEPGTVVPIHQHPNTSETVVCLHGCLDWIFYEEIPLEARNDAPQDIVDARFREVRRVRICPSERKYGVQVPPKTWHSVMVHEPSTIFEAKDGAYAV